MCGVESGCPDVDCLCHARLRCERSVSVGRLISTAKHRQWRLHDGIAGARGHRLLQIVASPPPNLADPLIATSPTKKLSVLLTHCGRLILRKISKFGATRCQILKVKCIKLDFRWGTPLGELIALPRPLSCI